MFDNYLLEGLWIEIKLFFHKVPQDYICRELVLCK